MYPLLQTLSGRRHCLFSLVPRKGITTTFERVINIYGRDGQQFI